jgi:hypothetical protein
MKQQGLKLLLLVAFLISSAYAQEPDVDRLDEKLHRHLEMKMPGWSYQRIQPIQGSKGVLLQKWTIENRGVNISIVNMKSAESAKEAIQRLAHDPSTHALPLSDTGDEAYTWGYGNRQIVFRKGKTLVYVEAGADVARDADARSLTGAERKAREETEVKRVRGEFVKHIIDSLDAP